METFTYNAVDWIALGIIAWEIIMGLRRKMAGELFRLLCTALVLAAGWRYYSDIGAWLAENTRLSASPEAAQAIAFAIIVILLGICCALLHLIMALLMEVRFNILIDRIGGAIMGLLRGALIVMMLIFAGTLWPSETLREVLQEKSCAGRITAQIAPPLVRMVRAVQVDFRMEAPAEAMPETTPETTMPSEIENLLPQIINEQPLDG